ncbi:ArsR family transcriptional regulator [Nostoc sp. FACHB-280]|uniref:ArsR family transcriptional regulator n=1 Tax=Nostoc sp. FACHB-280 TaxID=2692839 RepID=UPI00168B1179|nr:ArsR family transcriptional regulator [Nostoc sp. FACHB-280]MBD2496771.1 ArsR family transcriptional regulator [Nostoc sp. FACHB-280]
MSKLLIDGQHALYSPALASQIGRSAATVLQQAHYWMSIKGGKTIDGVKWFWKTYPQWAAELSLSVSTVRRAIALLKSLGLITIEKLSAKTYYQANWYTVNTQAVQLFLNEQMDMPIMQPSMCSQQADDIKEFTPEKFSSQQHAAAEEEKNEGEESQISDNEPESVCLTSQPEQLQITRFVDEQEQDDSTNDKDPHEDELSGVETKADFSVSKQEIAEICNELRRLRINPQPCLGVIKKHWENVQGAITRVKDAIAEGWCDNPTGLFINSCKSGAKGKNTVTADVSAWFEWARRQRIVLAMSGNVVYTPDGAAVELREMMRRFPWK